MATTHRTKQVNLRFPLPLLSQIKTKADAQQQAIADWILAAVSREFEPEAASPEQAKNSPAGDAFVLHPEILEYVKNCLAAGIQDEAEATTSIGGYQKTRKVNLLIIFMCMCCNVNSFLFALDFQQRTRKQS